MNLIDIAIEFQHGFYPHIPYRTGRLAKTGMKTDFYSPQGKNSIGFDFCVDKGLEYGIILNECPIIANSFNERQGSYINRHYGYFDNFFDNFANTLAIQLGGNIIRG